VLPGLDHELSDAMKAMIEWCNEQGGINGRQIEGTYYDAKFSEVVNVTQDACQKVFMLVGQGWANDTAQEETRLGCDLASVPGFTVSAEFANAPLMVQGVPNPIDVTPGAWADQLAEAFPDEVKQAGVMFANVAATIDTKDKAVQAAEKFGWQFRDCPQQYGALGEADWRPFAQRLKNCGVEAVNYVGTPIPNFQQLLDGAAQLDYEPIWFAEANNYDGTFAEWNTNGNGDNVYVRLSFTPFEEADANPATKLYVDLVTENGGDIALLGVQATSSFLLWATAAKECGSDLTRQCVLDNATQVTEWTAGGLHAPSNPGENLPPECGLLVKLEGTKWVRFTPEEPNTFDCDDGYRVKVTGRVVDQAQLGPDRVSTKFAP
jgi:ABC-type branched-subunit amino acid transport system substrate-binding protein